MSSDRLPCRSEVMGWSPQKLADFLKTMSVPGCDKVVLKNSFSGARFVNLTDNDLQKFPKLHAPMISRICNDISKNNGKKGGLFIKKPTPTYQEPETNTEGGWDEDEFDEDFDDDYESPYSDDGKGSGGDYESPDEDTAGEYEPPPTEPSEVHKLGPSQPIGNGVYIGVDRRDNKISTQASPPDVCARPPVHTLFAPPAQTPRETSFRRDSSPHVARQPSGKFPPEPPKVFRDNKPGRESRSNPSTCGGPQSHTPDRQSAQSWRSQPDGSDPLNRPKLSVLPPPSSSSARESPSRFDGRKEQTQDEHPKHNTFPFHKSLTPRLGIQGAPAGHSDGFSPTLPSVNPLPHKPNTALANNMGNLGAGVQNSFRPRPPPPSAFSSEGLDPRWYIGKVTRGQAEACLKRVNKDGAYLVRDSTRQQDNQPFTLMVLYQDKVYNIQVRQQNQQYQLGTGLKSQECFPSVSDIISHYSQSALVLIDAKNRSCSQQNQCLLSDPAGYCMKSQTWS